MSNDILMSVAKEQQGHNHPSPITHLVIPTATVFHVAKVRQGALRSNTKYPLLSAFRKLEGRVEVTSLSGGIMSFPLLSLDGENHRRYPTSS